MAPKEDENGPEPAEAGSSSSVNWGGDIQGSPTVNISQVINNYQGEDKEEFGLMIKEMVAQALSDSGITAEGAPDPDSLRPEDRGRIEDALDASSEAEDIDIEFDPWEYVTLANAAKMRHRLFSAEDYAEQALHQFRENSDRRGEAYSLYILGEVHYLRGDSDKAEPLYQEGLSISKDMVELWQEVIEARCLNGLGKISARRGEADEAERLYLESLSVSKEINDRKAQAKALHNLATVARARGDYVDTGRLYRESLSIERGIGNTYGATITMANLGSLELYLDNLDEAERLLLEALTNIQEQGFLLAGENVLNNLTKIARKRGDHEKARRLALRAVAFAREGGDEAKIMAAIYRQGKTAISSKDFKEARRLIEKHLAHVLENRSGLPSRVAKTKEFFARTNLGICAAGLDEDAESEVFCRDSLAIARGLNRPKLIKIAIGHLIINRKKLGDWDEMEKLNEERLKSALELGDKRAESECFDLRGILERKRGDFAEAERCFRQSLEIDRGGYWVGGSTRGAAHELKQLGHVAIARGRIDDALELYRESARLNAEAEHSDPWLSEHGFDDPDAEWADWPPSGEIHDF